MLEEQTIYSNMRYKLGLLVDRNASQVPAKHELLIRARLSKWTHPVNIGIDSLPIALLNRIVGYLFWLLVFACSAHAETVIGRVVGVADGYTLTVLDVDYV